MSIEPRRKLLVSGRNRSDCFGVAQMISGLQGLLGAARRSAEPAASGTSAAGAPQCRHPQNRCRHAWPPAHAPPRPEWLVRLQRALPDGPTPQSASRLRCQSRRPHSRARARCPLRGLAPVPCPYCGGRRPAAGGRRSGSRLHRSKSCSHPLRRAQRTRERFRRGRVRETSDAHRIAGNRAKRLSKEAPRGKRRRRDDSRS